jgi:hypothetical protein
MKITAAILSLFLLSTLYAQEGYEIKVTLKPFKNQYVYLGHYFGRQLPIIDSVKLNEQSQGVFKGTKKLGGGIYLIGFPDRSRNFEILVGKNQKFSVVADTATLPKITYINSTENNSFAAYQDFMVLNGRAMDSLQKRVRSSPQDSAKLAALIEVRSEGIKKYRADIIGKDEDGLLATLLKGMREPEVPKNHPDAKKDSLFAWRYFKTHYWDGVNFWDDRLVRTPFFEPRIDKYFDQVVYLFFIFFIKTSGGQILFCAECILQLVSIKLVLFTPYNRQHFRKRYFAYSF